MSAIRIIATAGDLQISNEVLAAVKQVLGEKADLRACPIGNLPAADAADLFICISSRTGEVAKKVPSQKVLGIELAPETRFYIELAKFPSGQVVHVFNNSTNYAKTLIRYCEEMGINHLSFEIIPYDELTEAEVINRLRQARIVIGVETIIGQGGVFAQRFKQYVSADTRVLAAKRVTSVKSACDIMEWITRFGHANMVGNVTELTSQLTQQMQGITAIVQRVSATMEQGSAAYGQMEAKMLQGKDRLAAIKNLTDNLSGAAKSIGNIVDSINHISTQTNLLALNATIEAARVGEAGRGFAVVAKEVGKLAAESHQSTETIRRAIADIQAAVEQIAPAVNIMANEMADSQSFFAAIAQTSQAENKSIMGVFDTLENIKAISERLVAAVSKL